MELLSTTALLLTAGALGWRVGRRSDAPADPDAPPSTLTGAADDPSQAESSGGTLSLGGPSVGGADTVEDLRKQLEAARVASYSARHALNSARDEANQLRATLASTQARFDEELARARIAERMHVASRRAREEALEQRASLEDALSRTQARVRQLEQEVRQLKEAAEPAMRADQAALAEVAAERDQLRAEVLQLRKALEEAAAAPSPRDGRGARLLAERDDLAAQLDALQAERDDLVVQLEAALLERDGALADLAATEAEAISLRKRIFKAPGA